MKCIIPGLNVKILGRAIHSMARIGDELYVEPTPQGLVLKSINSSESVYCSVTFSRAFFTFYSPDHRSTEPALCKISMKSALGVFKSPTHMDKQVEVCEIKLDPSNCKLVFTLRCKHAIIRTHFLSILDCRQMGAEYSKDMLPNRLSAQHRVLSDAVSNFQTSEDKVTVEVNPQTFLLRNYADQTDLSKIIRTQISLKPVEFDYYSVGVDTNITFSMKEFRAVLSFAEAVNLPISLQFEITGKPAIFTIDNNSTFEADFVMATESPDSVTQQTASTTQAKRNTSKRSSTNGFRDSSAAKKPHLDKEDLSKCLDEDSHLFNFIEMPDETTAHAEQPAPNREDPEESAIPGSPTSCTRVRRTRAVFQRCLEATMDPSRWGQHHAMLATDSDCEDV